jgi:hypothetical protein
MKTDDKNQEKISKDLEKTSKQVDGVSEYRDILSRVIHEGEAIFKIKTEQSVLVPSLQDLKLVSVISTLHCISIISGKSRKIQFSNCLVLYISRFYTGSVGKSALLRNKPQY